MLHLFTDASVNTKLGFGYGAYLILDDEELEQEVKKEIKIKKFFNTSSTKIELQTLLWALSEINELNITSYTDSLNIIKLTERRKNLEMNNFHSKSGNILNNYLLYKEFYQYYDKLNLKLIKIKGHSPKDQKNNLDRIFSLVDKASRKALKTKE